MTFPDKENLTRHYPILSRNKTMVQDKCHPFWKSLKHMESFLNISLEYHIRDGDIVRLWQDNWLGIPLKEILNILYTFAYMTNK
jgi:hypothetical protein